MGFLLILTSNLFGVTFNYLGISYLTPKMGPTAHLIGKVNKENALGVTNWC